MHPAACTAKEIQLHSRLLMCPLYTIVPTRTITFPNTMERKPS